MKLFERGHGTSTVSTCATADRRGIDRLDLAGEGGLNGTGVVPKKRVI